MTKLNNKIKKSKLSNTATKPSKKILKKEPESSIKPTLSSPDSSDSEPDYEPEDLVSLLEPYTKEQLIAFISAAAADDPAIHNRVVEMADTDVSHRKVFVHGLGWDTTRDAVVSAFSLPGGGGDGDIEDCKVVTDKVTGKSKGYAFVLFRTRKAAARALRTPQRRINNRVVSCQLASVGPNAPTASRDQGGPPGERKIYVNNVQRDVDKERLRLFFEQFGEIETGPIGFDINTGKSRGFAIFVYRTVEGARRVLEQPNKLFQGHQLHCQKAIDWNNRTNNNTIDHSNVPGGQNQMLAAVAAAQNLALFGQQQHHPQAVMNPAIYGGLLAAANPGLINPMAAGALNQGVAPTGPVGAMGGLGGANLSMLGAYGTGQGLQSVYPSAPVRKQGTPGSFPGYTSYMWYCMLK